MFRVRVVNIGKCLTPDYFAILNNVAKVSNAIFWIFLSLCVAQIYGGQNEE